MDLNVNLTKEQQEIVNSKREKLIVKGIAGSGKTLVAVKKASNILKDRNRKVLLLTYTNVLVNDLKNYFKYDSNIEIDTVDNFIYEKVWKKVQEVEKRDIYSSKVKYNRMDFKFADKAYTIGGKVIDLAAKIKFIDRKEYKDEILADIEGTRFDFDFIKEQFKYIESNDFSKKEYKNAKRIGNIKRLSSDEKTIIYDCFKRYQKRLERDERMTTLGAYKYLAENFDKKFNITDIIVDESQDLNKLQLLILTRIKNIIGEKCSINIFYDDSQSIYNNSYLGFNGKLSGINIGTNKIFRLGKPQRTTREIMKVGNKILEAFETQDKETEAKIIPDYRDTRKGEKPVLFKADNAYSEFKKIGEDIEELLKTYKPSDIMVIVPNPSDGIYKDFMDSCYQNTVFIKSNYAKYWNNKNSSKTQILEAMEAKEKYESDEYIRMYNSYVTKGLEAKVVIMINLQEVLSNCESKEKTDISQIYHVLTTRAKDKLYMYSVGEPNEYIGCLNEKLINIVEDEDTDDLGDISDFF